MKARPVTVHPALGAVLGAEVIGIAAFAGLPTYRFGWWPAAAITVVAMLLLFVSVHRRNAAAWVRDRSRWMRERRHTTAVAAAVNISHGGNLYGVRTADHEAVTMIEVDGRPYSPTYLRGSTLALTDNLLPLDVVIGLMEQPGGLHLGIDVASAGYRVRPGTGYPQLYSTLLADRGAAGQRTTHLIVRLDINESVRGLMYRRSIGSAAAASTERIVKALEQQGCRARALTAEEQDAMLEDLSMGLACAPRRPVVVDDAEDPEDSDGSADGVDARELIAAKGRHRHTGAATRTAPNLAQRTRPKADVGWKTINAKPGYVTSYYFSPEDITTDSFNKMWSLRSDNVVHVMRLRKIPGGPVKVSALVRTNDPRPPEQPPTLFLNTLPGDQYNAALCAAPTSQPALRLPARTLSAVDELHIPVGPTGILVGAALRDDKKAWPPIQRDDLVMWTLTDPAQPTRIVMDTSDFYVRQLLIRVAAAGERIAIYSHEPQRWYSVSQTNIAVVEARRPAEFVPTVIVNDRATIAPQAGLSSTVITVGLSPTDAMVPDIHFQQTSESTVRITTAARTVDLSMVVFRQEQTWTGNA
ncbi:type VII secretion protein EccE [Mycobacterium sp. 1465703.0]|uniref:type VII secretion protein EccE n=1 Tax=Mycobacterium sp. 1465703.0 TaxID=1834078 RepID=UPI00080107BB|nr:type VII secretion protein EccE [Mycobacterium sp. 1465703.0]OBJ10844.1 type VII secretion protein EccE [Mycobacterium sp. 1465703.0]